MTKYDLIWAAFNFMCEKYPDEFTDPSMVDFSIMRLNAALSDAPTSPSQETV